MSAAPPHPEQQPIEVDLTAPGTEPAPEEEILSETLYIQNLNERIKIPGTIAGHPLGDDNLPNRYSAEGILTRSLQIVWRGPRCRRAQEPADAWTGFRFIRVHRYREEGGEGGSRVSAVLETHGTAFL